MKIFSSQKNNIISKQSFGSAPQGAKLSQLGNDVFHSSLNELNQAFKFPLSRIELIGKKYLEAQKAASSFAKKDELMTRYDAALKKVIDNSFQADKKNTVSKEFIHDCTHQATGSFLQGQQTPVRFMQELMPDLSKEEQLKVADECADKVVKNANETCRRYQSFLDKKMDKDDSTIGADKLFDMIKEDFFDKAKAKNIKLIVHGEDLLKEHSLSTHSDYKNYIVESNLVANAIKYSPENSVIEMGFKIKENDKYLHFFIKDQGIGIPEESKRGVLYSERATNVGAIPGEGHGLYRANAFVAAETGGEEIKITSPLYPEEANNKGTMFECPLISDITKKFIKID